MRSPTVYYRPDLKALSGDIPCGGIPGVRVWRTRLENEQWAKHCASVGPVALWRTETKFDGIWLRDPISDTQTNRVVWCDVLQRALTIYGEAVPPVEVWATTNKGRRQVTKLTPWKRNGDRQDFINRDREPLVHCSVWAVEFLKDLRGELDFFVHGKLPGLILARSANSSWVHRHFVGGIACSRNTPETHREALSEPSIGSRWYDA